MARILNLYAGIGGNRKHWGGEHEITAVERDREVAGIYAELYPSDNLVIGDAHEYLKDHYADYDIVWSSPPCPTHSQIRYFTMVSCKARNRALPKYPDMRLYAEVLFLRYHATPNGIQWLVENVVPYYPPLIPPSAALGKHMVWTSNPISDWSQPSKSNIRWDQMSRDKLIDWLEYPEVVPYMTRGVYKDRQALRNCVHPRAGLHALNELLHCRQSTLF
ncbi:MAG: DNA cytosine methyltransferase [Rhodospirillaceae bacterium]|nr:DNA cytosine methyltransferase [Rhodospirillaceae bacterium]